MIEELKTIRPEELLQVSITYKSKKILINCQAYGDNVLDKKIGFGIDGSIFTNHYSHNFLR